MSYRLRLGEQDAKLRAAACWPAHALEKDVRVFICICACIAYPAVGAILRVDQPRDLSRAIEKAARGDIILLGPGKFGNLKLANRDFDITFRSREASSPAEFSGVYIISSSNIALEGIKIGRSRGSEPEYGKIVEIRESKGIRFEGGQINGSIDGDPSNDMWGVYARGVDGLKIKGVHFEEHFRGVLVDRCSDVSIDRNDFLLMRSDAVNLAGSSNVSVTGNLIAGFKPAPADHPDGVQGWTAGQKTGLDGVVIADNLIVGAPQGRPQGIFIRDELNLYRQGHGHRNVQILRNTILVPLWHGIMLGPCVNCRIVGNSVLNRPGGPPVPGGPIVPRITYSPGTTVQQNRSPRYVAEGQPGFVTPKGNSQLNTEARPRAIEEAIAKWKSTFR